MTKLLKPTDLRLGKVYNLEYVGDNEAYARVNGKRTILILEVRPEFKYVKLYSAYGDPLCEDIRDDSPTTVCELASSFKEDQITEPAGEDDWFKHSMRFTSLYDALHAGVLTEQRIKSHPVGRRSARNAILCPADSKGCLGAYTRFCFEDKPHPQYPQLQSVFIVWKTWSAAAADFKCHGVVVS